MNSASAFASYSFRSPTLSILPLLNSSNPNPQQKLEILVSEFKSLREPIVRVKQLIHYASLLPELEESVRVESNRVTGCTAQVWLEVVMEVDGTMRFRADSDSEIAKGFCYCLIWFLDGAAAGDVIEIRVDDLGEMNIGILAIRTSSRVNTWHNLLLSMQRRTRDLIIPLFLPPLAALISNVDH
ncbi:hypothetical protein L1987_72455 [Smallanthus sonchifolius]|uniref:Uncharacterized protein n=1 Tax=Smallanthus sonchifolius TaxID=185202 RepID=A0ACB9AWZ3_9ASTR|nr:hypothetical protein L1987_72455 [Smallanthus sonchifolius]